MSYLRAARIRPELPRWSTSVLQATRPNSSLSESPDWPHPLFASSRLTDRKSTFLAHVSALPDPTALPRLLAHLHTLPRLNAKRATHCMYAYRAAGVAGQSDGGEGGSGDRLARLLALTACDNVVVVVWRWYGGVKLGADRWKRISEVGKEALDLGGFLSKKDEGQYKSKGKKKK